MSDQPTNPGAEDYKVGCGNPPRHKQFHKGQSGNPGGRLRGITAGRANALVPMIPAKLHSRTQRQHRRWLGALNAAAAAVHPVDALDRKPHMPAENIGHALCYHAPGSGRGYAPLARGVCCG